VFPRNHSQNLFAYPRHTVTNPRFRLGQTRRRWKFPDPTVTTAITITIATVSVTVDSRRLKHARIFCPFPISCTSPNVNCSCGSPTRKRSSGGRLVHYLIFALPRLPSYYLHYFHYLDYSHYPSSPNNTKNLHPGPPNPIPNNHPPGSPNLPLNLTGSTMLSLCRLSHLPRQPRPVQPASQPLSHPTALSTAFQPPGVLYPRISKLGQFRLAW
jgi:hypothetical protein